MQELLLRWSVLMLDVSLKTLLLATVAGVVLAVLRVRNSSLKHAAWLGVLSSLVVLPVLSMVVPAISIPFPVQWLTSEVSASSPGDLGQADILMTQSATADQRANGLRLSPSLHSDTNKGGLHAEPNGELPATVAAAVTVNQTPQQSTNNSVSPATLTGRFALTRWLPVVASLWLAGAVLLLLRVLLSVHVTRRLVQQSTPLPSSDLPQIATDSTHRSQSQLATFRESSVVFVPLTTGWRRPSILLPTAWRNWTDDKLEHVMAHELSHIRRGDCWTALLTELVVCVYWFHPLVWWLKQRLASLAEECCDDAAIHAAGNRLTYARHLLEIASTLCERPHRLNYAGLAMTRQLRVERRILAILDQQRPLSQRLTRLSAFLLLAASIPLISVAAALQPSKAVLQLDDKADANNRDGTANKDATSTTSSGTNADKAQTSPATDSGSQVKRVRIHGRITRPSAQPLDGAFVALTVYRLTAGKGHTEALAETITDRDGHYELNVPIDDPKLLERPQLIVRADGCALGWKDIDLSQPETFFGTVLANEQPVRLKLIDIQGNPASGISLENISIIDRLEQGDRQNHFFWPFDKKTSTKAGLPELVSDRDGSLTIPHLSADHGAYIYFAATDKTAPQSLQLNTGAPEERPERDATYRGLVRNFKPGEVGTITLAPARMFEGVVLLGDTSQPAANAKITIWSSEQQPFGSMTALESQTDANGRFRLNPYPGIRFGIHAHPPAGAPYLVKNLDDLKWESGDAVRKIEIRLPSGLVARGQLIDGQTGKPLPKGTVQYLPNQAKNPNLPPNTITGWQGIQYTDQQGRFEISIPPGAGTLLFHAAPGTHYVLQEKGQQEIDRGTQGGWRYYAHAYRTIDPDSPSDNPAQTLTDLTIKLQPGATVKAKLVDEKGQPIKDAIFTSRLNISSFSPFWRAFSEPAKGGFAEIRGLEPGVKYPVYFLDVRRQLGAVAEVSVDEAQPTVVLKPCATAKARFVDAAKKPVKKGLSFGLNMVVTPGVTRYSLDPSKRNELRADEDFSSNFDQVRGFSGTDANGVEIFRYLVPGVTYRISNPGQDRPDIEFVAESGKTHDLGDIIVNLN